MGIPVGYRKITYDDVGKTFGVNLETVIKFDDVTSLGYWYITAEPRLPFNDIEWMIFSDGSYFNSQRGGNLNFWTINTSFRDSKQSISEGSLEHVDDYIISTSKTVDPGTTIINMWNLDTRWMNYVYVKDKFEHTITFDGQGGRSPDPQATTNEKLTELPPSTRTGYKFLGWYRAISGGEEITLSTEFDGDTTVYAQWAVKDYTIKFYDYNDLLVESFEKYYGESITLPIPSDRLGYTFNGWSSDRDWTTYHRYNGSGPQITWTTVPDLGELGQKYSFYARYVPKVYTLYYDYLGFEYNSYVTYNEPYNLSELDRDPDPKEGYTWEGWYESPIHGERITSTSIVKMAPIDNSFYVYPRWRRDPFYTITFSNTKGNDTVRFVSAPQDYKVDPLPSATADGFVFQGWYTEASGGDRITKEWVFSEDTTVHAQWKGKVYTLYFSDGGFYPSTVTYNEPYDRSELDSEPFPKEGYTWEGWYDASSGGNKITSASVVDIVTSNSYIYAHARWTQDPVYTITFSDTKGNSTTRDISSPQNYKVNLLPSASANGFDFQGWYTATSGGDRITTEWEFSADTTVYAQWIPVGYRKITSNDVEKIFGFDLETVIKFDDAISVGYWYINAEPPFNEIVWMEFSDSSNFYSGRGGKPSFWMVDTYFRGSKQSASEGAYPNIDDYIRSTSETVPSGVSISNLWELDPTWMNHVYVKDKESKLEYTITFNSNGGTSLDSQQVHFQDGYKLTELPSPTRTGYKFLDWYTKTSGGDRITKDTVFSADTTIYAQWDWQPKKNYKDFAFRNKLLSEFNGFIINEGNDLKFFNPSDFSHEFTTPQSSNRSFLTGTSRENREFNFNIFLQEVTLKQYKEFLDWLNPEYKGVLILSYNTDYGYDVKVNSISEGTFYVCRECEKEDRYNIELEIGFITEKDWAARFLKEEHPNKVELIYYEENPQEPYHKITNNQNLENYLIIKFQKSLEIIRHDYEKDRGRYWIVKIVNKSLGSSATYYSQYGIAISENGNFLDGTISPLVIPPKTSIDKYLIDIDGSEAEDGSIEITSREII